MTACDFQVAAPRGEALCRDRAAAAVPCLVVLEGGISYNYFVIGSGIDAAAVFSGIVLKVAFGDSQIAGSGEHDHAGIACVFDGAAGQIKLDVLVVFLTHEDTCACGLVDGDAVELVGDVVSVLVSDGVAAAEQGTVLDGEVGVGFTAEDRLIGASGVVEGVAAEIDGDGATVVDVEVVGRAEAVLFPVEVIEVEAVVLVCLHVGVHGDGEVLAGGRSLCPCFGEVAEAFFLDTVYRLRELDGRAEHCAVAEVVVDHFFVSLVKGIHGLAEGFLNAFVIGVGILVLAYLIDTLVDLILSDLVRHVVEGEHGDVVQAGVIVDGGQLAVDVLLNDL